MTTDQPAAVRDVVAEVTTARERYVDVFRGVLIAHMALDHASLMFNAGRGGEELAAVAPSFPDDIWQFLTRFTGIPVAPAFCLMAGLMVALTTMSRTTRGITHQEITRRLLVRGLVLIAADAIIMGLPRLAMGFYSFMVLSAIGVGIIIVALAREAPTRILLPCALGVLVLHPLLDVSALPVALRAVIYEPVRTGAIRSMYPIIPWSAIVVLGFVVGRITMRRERTSAFWFALAGTSLLVFALVRLMGSYGNAYPYTSVLSRDFWFFAKYPPDLPFLAWAFAMTFATLGTLRLYLRDRAPRWLRPFEIFGRVPFFFYIVHFYILGVAAALVGAKLTLLATLGVWTALLAAMLPLCVWYHRRKLERPNFITRYI